MACAVLSEKKTRENKKTQKERKRAKQNLLLRRMTCFLFVVVAISLACTRQTTRKRRTRDSFMVMFVLARWMGKIPVE